MRSLLRPRLSADAEDATGDDRPEAPGKRFRALLSLPSPGVAALFTVAIGVGAWLVQLGSLIDNSFLWHLKTGHWILEHGIPRRDFYSFTASGEPWVSQSWLAEVGYAWLDRVFGPVGIRLFRGFTGMLIAVLAYRLALCLTRHTARAAFMTTAAVAASVPFWAGRPLVFGILAMLVLLWIVEVPDSRVGVYPLVSICGVMWLWANLHGTFALGFLYLALHIAGQWLDGHPPIRGREKRLSIATLVAFGLCFINPYGLDLILFPVQMLSRGQILGYVVEWSSPDFHNAIGILFAIWLVSFVGVLLLAARRPSRRDLVMSAAFVLLALWAQRNIALAPIVGLPIIARLSAIAELRDRGRLLNYVLIPVIIALGVNTTVSQLNKPDFDLQRYPVQAMQAIEQRGMLGRRIATTDDWGGFVIYAYWPRQRVFIDDRYDMYPTTTVHDYFKLLAADPSWSGTLDKHRIDVVLWPRNASLTTVLAETANWEQIYQDDKSTVFARR